MDSGKILFVGGPKHGQVLPVHWLAQIDFTTLPPVKVSYSESDEFFRPDPCTRDLYSLVQYARSKGGQPVLICALYQHESLSTDELNDWMNPRPVEGFEVDEMALLLRLLSLCRAGR